MSTRSDDTENGERLGIGASHSLTSAPPMTACALMLSKKTTGLWFSVDGLKLSVDRLWLNADGRGAELLFST